MYYGYRSIACRSNYHLFNILLSGESAPAINPKGGVCMAGISSDIIRGYNDTIILYLLLDKPSYGYEISKQIKP